MGMTDMSIVCILLLSNRFASLFPPSRQKTNVILLYDYLGKVDCGLLKFHIVLRFVFPLILILITDIFKI